MFVTDKPRTKEETKALLAIGLRLREEERKKKQKQQVIEERRQQGRHTEE